jgi:glyoxylate carboligase
MADPCGAEVLVANLESQGVTHVFGVPGAKVDRVFDVLADSTIKTVVCRHEQNASFIAQGLGRMTGRAGVSWSPQGQVRRTSSQGSLQRPPKARQSSGSLVRYHARKG